MSTEHILIVGAGSKIAQSLIQRHLDKDDVVYAVSRNHDTSGSSLTKENWFITDHSEKSIKHIITQISLEAKNITRIYICCGLLHNDNLKPEKKVDDWTIENANTLFHVNAFIPMLWIKTVKPIVRMKHRCTITLFSARVGSISDNRSGGWYNYRASKAALNMFLKTASIEYTRMNKQLRFLAFHPGTVDTPLSKPFQKSVKSEKLFQAEFVAHQLDSIISTKILDQALHYLDWEGKEIAF